MSAEEKLEAKLIAAYECIGMLRATRSALVEAFSSKEVPSNWTAKELEQVNHAMFAAQIQTYSPGYPEWLLKHNEQVREEGRQEVLAELAKKSD
jgi:hypothetical protein